MMGQGKVILRPQSVTERTKDIAGKKSLSPGYGRSITDDLSLLHSRFPRSPWDTPREPRGAEKVLPWAGPLLLSWTGLLGWRQIMASGQCCRETAVPRSSFSAKHSRAEATACRQQGQRSEAERG